MLYYKYVLYALLCVGIVCFTMSKYCMFNYEEALYVLL